MRLPRAVAAAAVITVACGLPATAATAATTSGHVPAATGTAVAPVAATVTIDIGAGVTIEIVNGVPYYSGAPLRPGQTVDSGIFIHYDGKRLYTRTQGGNAPYSVWDARTGRFLGTQAARPGTGTSVPTRPPGPARGGVGGSTEDGNTTEIVVGAVLAATALGVGAMRARRRLGGDHR
ncbi:hypothetical protein ACLGI4_04200 [Streptomyces sp. HMX112]|uniref:hypothetical protein n=1 Tax=Streptomyces sp. HMX112 TaxID=3390850 RepID=UPI003A7F687B